MSFLDDDLLASIRSRAAGYDAANAFPHDDLKELRAAGYLRAHVPADFGGSGIGLRELAREQSRLATAAPATALAIGMHLVWTGVARTLLERGDSSLSFVLREAAAGEIFAFAISEPGNDLVLFDSTTDARPQPDGGYAFTGTKIFTSLSPVWTRLGVFGRDDADPADPRLVHAMLDRAASGITVLDDWDTLGMRATQSGTTRLDGVVAPASRVFRRLAPGPSADGLIFGVFANFSLLIAAVYRGIGERALELAVESARSRTSRRTGTTRDQDPDVRRRIAEIALALDAVSPRIDTLATDLETQVDHGSQWFRLLVGAKIAATAAAKQAVDGAMAVAGGASFATSDELSRLYRDVAAGTFHPSSEDSAKATVATALLGPIG